MIKLGSIGGLCQARWAGGGEMGGECLGDGKEGGGRETAVPIEPLCTLHKQASIAKLLQTYFASRQLSTAWHHSHKMALSVLPY